MGSGTVFSEGINLVGELARGMGQEGEGRGWGLLLRKISQLGWSMRLMFKPLALVAILGFCNCASEAREVTPGVKDATAVAPLPLKNWEYYQGSLGECLGGLARGGGIGQCNLECGDPASLF